MNIVESGSANSYSGIVFHLVGVLKTDECLGIPIKTRTNKSGACRSMLTTCCQLVATEKKGAHAVAADEIHCFMAIEELCCNQSDEIVRWRGKNKNIIFCNKFASTDQEIDINVFTLSGCIRHA